MKKLIVFLLFPVTVLLTGCSSPQILIASNKYHYPHNHRKIMTVGVLKGNNDSMRLHLERNISGDLGNLGYFAVSALEELGPTGLTNLSQEETYLKLCNQGIDAVLIVTLIDKRKDTQFRTSKSYIYPDNYYFNRIWNYKNIQADLSGHNKGLQSSCFWEAILFDLGTLEAECTIQSASFTLSPGPGQPAEFEKLLIKKMIKEKVLKQQTTRVLKPF